MIRRSLFFALGFLALAQTAHAQEWVAFAGGGFSGKRIPVAVQRPVIEAGVPSSEFVDIEVDHNLEWRPTVTGGVEVRWYGDGEKDNLYKGFAAFVAVLSEGADPDSFAPGLAFSIGKKNFGFILGVVFSPSDQIRLPDGQESFRARIGAIPNFRTQATSNWPRMFIGFRGVSINFGTSNEEPEAES